MSQLCACWSNSFCQYQFPICFHTIWSMKKLLIKIYTHSKRICKECKLMWFPLRNLSLQLSHWELTLKLSVGSFWGHSISSKWTHKMIHTVSLLWAFREFATHMVSLLWAICEITQWAHHAVVEVSSLLKLQTHGKLTANSQYELIMWVQNALTECPPN